MPLIRLPLVGAPRDNRHLFLLTNDRTEAEIKYSFGALVLQNEIPQFEAYSEFILDCLDSRTE